MTSTHPQLSIKLIAIFLITATTGYSSMIHPIIQELYAANSWDKLSSENMA